MSGVARVADKLVALDRRRAVQTVFVGGKSMSAAETPSTTNTATFVPALTWAWDELPDGIYLLSVEGSFLGAHSANGAVNLRLVAETAEGTTFTLGVVNESPATTRLMAVETFVDLVVSGAMGMTITLEYKGNVAGTSSARNPAVRATAIRVG